MTIEQFRPEQSSRGNVLFSAVSPYLHNGMTVLDIGCAYACLLRLILKKFPATRYFGFDNSVRIIREMQRRRPRQSWARVDIRTGNELKDLMWKYKTVKGAEVGIRGDHVVYDLAIHIGVDDMSWTNIWMVHVWLVNYNPPRYVFLESGRKDGYEGPRDTHNHIESYYIKNGYSVVSSGQFQFDYAGDCLRDRRWSVVGRTVCQQKK